MIIYYPTYYLVPVAPVMFSYEDEYNTHFNTFYNDKYSIPYNIENNDDHNDNYGPRYNIESSEINNTYRTINKDIFYEVDEEYVNDSIK
ncbi:hypothetical protein KPL37_07750 [Clostridium frigoris]|uniref:Uncharacterized protein n=1 Tax=Clostridium frigoris TaxID=205327 RepID=A0ABS6BUW4_9CLOT|nr:hypothetical protein [Clostridium frigoris]MBU3159642.1 hypothetical protein [Clostridium frigoris]